jgi:lipoate-protein ligase A
MEAWRLLVSPAASGSWNMALDQALVESVAAGECAPTLRFYTWARPTLSIGYAQPIANVDLQTAAGVSVVRRRTGGQAILHDDEVTYALVLPRAHALAGSGIIDSYGALSQGLLAGLDLLGVQAAIGRWSPPPGQQIDDICFASPSGHEILTAGRKIVASAQCRLRGAVLQHGSIVLSHNADVYRLFGLSPRRPPDGLRACLPGPVTVGGLIQVFAQGFASALNVDLAPADPSSVEHARTQKLVRVRYADDAWLHRC